jgi:ABC-2 type transport system ATP-binding protein
VVEVETESPGAARRVLEAHDSVLGVAQLGLRLRVLVDRQRSDATALIESVLRESGVPASVEAARPNLEDVFVVATREREPVVEIGR